MTLPSPPSITDGVHCNENFVEKIPVFSTFSNFFEKKKNIREIVEWIIWVVSY